MLEEIAMYEDTPQELVHDLFSEAVFGSHALGPAGDRHGRGDLDDQQARDRRLPPLDVHAAATSSSRRRATSRTTGSSRCSQRFERAQRARPRDAAPHVRRPLVQAPPPGLRFQRKDTEQYHLCLGAPGISRSDRRRFAASLLDGDPRRLGLVAPLPGDPREARHGIRRLQLRVAVHRHRA